MIQTTSSAVDWFGQRRDSKMLGQINTVRDLIAAEGSPRLADSFFVGGLRTFAALDANVSYRSPRYTDPAGRQSRSCVVK